MNATAGTDVLVRLAARRSRIMLAGWCYVLIALVLGTGYSFRSLYPTPGSRLRLAATIAANPTFRALTGPTFDLTTVGGLTAWRVGGLGGLLIALMNILVVVRHTRGDEEAGRLELVGAGAVGRFAPLTASLQLAIGTDLVLGVVIGAGLTLLGLPAGDSFGLGMALAVVGAAFAGIAAFVAQLTESARAATGLAATVLGVSFLLRAVGDGGTVHWLSWLSPIGWGQQLQPFAADRWWVFALPAGFTVLTCWAAAAVVARRDLGAGLLPTRPGPAVAGRSLGSPLALAWRLHRGTFFGWLAAFAIVGGVLGAVSHDMVSVITSSPQLRTIIGQLGGRTALADALLSAFMGLLGLLCAVFTVQATMRLRAEESALRAEPVLATTVGRVPYAGGHLAIAAVGGGLLLVASGVFAGLAYSLRAGDIGQLPGVLAAAVVQLPAAWVLAALAMALIGLLPAYSAVSWAAVVVCFVLAEFGPSLKLPQWLMDVSPFTHLPRLPGGAVVATPIGWLVLVSVVLAVVGLAGFRRRDVV